VPTDTLIDDGFEEIDPAVDFWGGPLDGLRIEAGDQHLPDHKHKLFRHGLHSVLHDPDGPARTLYAFCPLHLRMEIVSPDVEAKLYLEPDDGS
jgi:hypothetical protein